MIAPQDIIVLTEFAYLVLVLVGAAQVVPFTSVRLVK